MKLFSSSLLGQRLRLLRKGGFPREFVKFTLYIVFPIVVFYAAGSPVLKQKMIGMLVEDNVRRELAKIAREIDGDEQVYHSNAALRKKQLHQERVNQFLEEQMAQNTRELEQAYKHRAKRTIDDEL